MYARCTQSVVYFAAARYPRMYFSLLRVLCYSGGFPVLATILHDNGSACLCSLCVKRPPPQALVLSSSVARRHLMSKSRVKPKGQSARLPLRARPVGGVRFSCVRHSQCVGAGSGHSVPFGFWGSGLSLLLKPAWSDADCVRDIIELGVALLDWLSAQPLENVNSSLSHTQLNTHTHTIPARVESGASGLLKEDNSYRKKWFGGGDFLPCNRQRKY